MTVRHLRRPPVRRRAAGLAVAAVLAMGPGASCGGEDPYCARAQAAFEDIGAIGRDRQAATDPAAVLARLKASFARLGDGAPDEVREDVAMLTRYVDSLQTAEDVARPEPPDVRAAGDRLAQWLGRSCDRP